MSDGPKGIKIAIGDGVVNTCGEVACKAIDAWQEARKGEAQFASEAFASLERVAGGFFSVLKVQEERRKAEGVARAVSGRPSLSE